MMSYKEIKQEGKMNNLDIKENIFVGIARK